MTAQYVLSTKGLGKNIKVGCRRPELTVGNQKSLLSVYWATHVKHAEILKKAVRPLHFCACRIEEDLGILRNGFWEE